MVIQHNIPSLNAWRNTKYNNNGVSKNLEKLSSGFRINRAADDAAGLAISEKMRGQIRGLSMAEMNVKHGINLIQTAEGALNEDHAILQRLRELAVQSSNGTYHDEVDRESLNKEYLALMNEIDRIAQTTHYNGIKLLDGSASADEDIVKAVRPTNLASTTIDTASQVVTITSNGIFDISSYSGYTIKIQGGNVELNGTASDVYIDCAESTNLFLDSINITNTEDKNMIKFTGVGNTINLLNGSLKRDVGNNASNTALIRTGDDTELTIQTIPSPVWLGEFTITDGKYGVGYTQNYRRGAVIGGDYGESTGKLTFTSPDGRTDLKVYAYSNSDGVDGAVIGSGACSTGENEIFIENWGFQTHAVYESGTPTAAVIGGGYNSGPLSITLNVGGINASLRSEDNSQSVVVGSGADSIYRANLTLLGALDLAAVNANYTGFWDYYDESAIYLGSPASSAGADITLIYDPNVTSVRYGNPGYIGSYGTAPYNTANINVILKNNAKGGLNSSNWFIGNGDNFRFKGNFAFAEAVPPQRKGPIVFQVGANGTADQRITLSIPSMRVSKLGISSSNIATQESANNAIEMIDSAINKVSSVRANLGAYQNRLEHTLNNLGITKENLQSAESSIRDVDMAKEMMEFTKNNILIQAAQSMLAQANQLPQGVLSLLR